MTTRPKTPYAVYCCGSSSWPPCNDGELVFLTKEEYNSQMRMSDVAWKCPMCGGTGIWNDANYEEHFTNG